MPAYTETEEQNLHVVRQMLGEEPGPADKSLLFADGRVVERPADDPRRRRGDGAPRPRRHPQHPPSANKGRGLLRAWAAYELKDLGGRARATS